jgi:hypothetical protein
LTVFSRADGQQALERLAMAAADANLHTGLTATVDEQVAFSEATERFQH